MSNSRKAQILEVAERHFAQHGFAGASLSAIARDCELGNPGLLHHFASKELLYRALLETLAQDLTLRLDQMLDQTPAPAQRLQGFIALQLDWMRERPLAAQLITRELLDNSERIATAQTRPLEQFLTTALTLIADAQATGHAHRDMAPLALLTVTLGSLNYAHMARPTFARAFDHPPLHEPAKWMQAMAEQLLQLLQTPVGSPVRPIRPSRQMPGDSSQRRREPRL